MPWMLYHLVIFAKIQNHFYGLQRILWLFCLPGQHYRFQTSLFDGLNISIGWIRSICIRFMINIWSYYISIQGGFLMFRFPCLFIIVGVLKVCKFCINQFTFPWLPGQIKKKIRIKERKYLIRQIIHNTIPILPLADRDNGTLSFKVSFFAKRSHKSTMCKRWEWSYNCISRGA